MIIGLTNPSALTASGQITAQSNQVIENLEFTDLKGDAATRGYHILVPDGVTNVTIRNCKFTGGSVDPGFYYLGAAVRIRVGCSNITVENCEFIDVARMVHAHFSGSNIVTRYNKMDSNYATQAVQYAECEGAGFQIVYNDIICGMQRWSAGDNRDQTMQDFINVYAGENVLIEGNRVEGRNNLVANPANSTGAGWGGDYSVIGAGIIVGDSQGDNCTIRKNYLINPATTSIMVSGGDGHHVTDNVVWGDGTINHWPWVGSGIGWQGWGGVGCPTNGHAQDNRVNYIQKWGARKDWWVMTGCFGPTTGNPLYLSEPELTAQQVRNEWQTMIDSFNVPAPEPEPEPEPAPEEEPPPPPPPVGNLLEQQVIYLESRVIELENQMDEVYSRLAAVEGQTHRVVNWVEDFNP